MIMSVDHIVVLFKFAKLDQDLTSVITDHAHACVVVLVWRDGRVYICATWLKCVTNFLRLCCNSV